MKISQPRVEHLVEPMGLDVPEPRFSWIVTSDRRADVQTAFQIQVATTQSGTVDLWDSGVVASDQTSQVVYSGRTLSSDQTCWWRVRAWDADDVASDWSDWTAWTTGLMDRSAWSASWIGAPTSIRPVAAAPEGLDLYGIEHQRLPWLRGTYDLGQAVRRARAFVTARGVYELYINGRRVGPDVLTPGWTDYRKRIQYQAYDVTPFLHPGANCIGALLGDGWWSGRIAWQHRFYGEQPSFLLQVHVELEDGTTTVLGTDRTWECAPSDVVWSDMLTGEEQDVAARRDWCSPSADGEAWVPVEVVVPPEAELVGQRAPTVRRLMELEPKSVTETAPGTFLVDLGQNMVGWLRLSVPGEIKGTLTIRHAEMLAGDGSFYTTNYRGAQCVDVYRLDGTAAGPVELEPHFTWRGFRFAEVSGLPPGSPPPQAVGVVLGSDLPRAGTFTCSNPMVSQLQRNIEWGQRGNFLEVPTDCPQRDERLGWMGDAQIFLPTACWNADVAAFFTKWLDDVIDARSPSGAFADVAPVVREELFGEAAPAWGDAGVILPWELYRRYGDVRLLEHCFSSMSGWVAYIDEANPDRLWRQRRNNDYGDWLAVGEDTPREVLSTAYFAHSADLVGRAARVLGLTAEAERHESLFEEVRAAFNDAYVTPSGRIVGNTQTTYLLALAFDLLPEAKRAAAAEALVALITDRRGLGGTFPPNHLATGFLGVGHLLPVLTATGNEDLAYRLLENETYPSWGYSIAQGATTIWERWDGWTEEGGFQNAGMNSFNHYSLGSVGEWLFSTVAGIATEPEDVGFRRLVIRPTPGGSITWARAEHDCIRGRVSVAWELTDTEMRVEVVVPTNTTAEVWLPGLSASSLTEGGRPAADVDTLELLGEVEGRTGVRVGGGTYAFVGGRTVTSAQLGGST